MRGQSFRPEHSPHHPGTALDPDFQKMLRENITILEDRYNQVLARVKQELQRLSG